MSPRRSQLARIRITGPDHKGIIAHITGFLYQKNLNIEDIDQRILEGFLVMNMVVSITDLKGSIESLRQSLVRQAAKIGMEAELVVQKKRKIKNAVILVTKEPHCLQALVKEMRTGRIKAKPKVIFSNRPDLEEMAKKLKIPFYYYPADKKKRHETHLIEHIREVEADVIILARYMQILSPEFCFRYEDRIINIHPSLLPAFPGATPYAQAYNKGVEIAGVTAHFATTDLDQGPIIAQESFRVDKNIDSIPQIIKKGQKLESKALCRAVQLFCADSLVLRRGKVLHSRHGHTIEQKAKEWY